MGARYVEWKIPWQEWTGIYIDNENREIGVRLRSENNLIICNEDNELYTDLQLADGLTWADSVPVWVLTGRVIQSNWWPQTGTLLSWKTTSWDLNQFLYWNDWKLYFRDWNGQWKTLLLSDWTYKTAVITDDWQGNVTLAMQYLILEQALAQDADSIEWLFNHRGQGGSVHIEIVAQLPASWSPDTIYFVSDWQGGYDEYVWDADNNDWIRVWWITIDLSNYVDKTSTESIGWQKTFLIEPVLPAKDSVPWDNPTRPATEAQVYDVMNIANDKFWVKEIYTTDTAYTLSIDEIERKTWQYHNFFHFLSDDTVYYYQQGDAVWYFQWAIDWTWNVMTLTTNQYSWFVRWNTMTFTRTDDWAWNYTYLITDVYTSSPDSAIDLTWQIGRINRLYANSATWTAWEDKINNNEDIYFNAHTVTPVFVWPWQGNTYSAWNGISIDWNNEISIDTSWWLSWQVLSINSQWDLEWINQQWWWGTYHGWTLINIDGNNNINIDPTWGNLWDVIRIWLSWNPEWMELIWFYPENQWQVWQVLKKTSNWYEWANESWGGGWTTYNAWVWIDIDGNNYINIDTTWWSNWQMLTADWSGWVMWTTPPTAQTYNGGTWINIDSSRNVNIDTSWASSWQVLAANGSGWVYWTNQSWGWGWGWHTYYAWDWIAIDSSYNISINKSWATQWQVLSVDWQWNVAWVTQAAARARIYYVKDDNNVDTAYRTWVYVINPATMSASWETYTPQDWDIVICYLTNWCKIGWTYEYKDWQWNVIVVPSSVNPEITIGSNNSMPIYVNNNLADYYHFHMGAWAWVMFIYFNWNLYAMNTQEVVNIYPWEAWRLPDAIRELKRTRQDISQADYTALELAHQVDPDVWYYIHP